MKRVDASIVWHQRPGHQSSRHLSFISDVGQIDFKDKHICDACFQAKKTRSPFLLSNNDASNCFDLIHCDLWGPYSKASSCGTRYFITIVDDHSRGTWVYLLKEKSEAGRHLMEFCNLVETQFGKIVKRISSDNGMEFDSRSIQSFYRDKGIIHETSCIDTPQ